RCDVIATAAEVDAREACAIVDAEVLEENDKALPERVPDRHRRSMERQTFRLSSRTRSYVLKSVWSRRGPAPPARTESTRQATRPTRPRYPETPSENPPAGFSLSGSEFALCPFLDQAASEPDSRRFTASFKSSSETTL